MVYLLTARAELKLGMGTRRPGTRQDLGPGTSRGLAEESRDVPRLYSCGPGTSRDPK